MNKQRMIELANTLESVDKERFDLRWYFAQYLRDEEGNILYDEDNIPEGDGISSKYFLTLEEKNTCDTTACIAGWAISKFRDQIPSNFIYKNEIEIARHLLDLELHEAYQLFYADAASLWARHADYFNLEVIDDESGVLNWSEIHPKHAAEMLTMLANEEISFLSDRQWYL